MRLRSFGRSAALIISVGVAGSLLGCSEAADEWPAQVRTNFIESCEAQPGATSEQCSRCFLAVKDAYTYDEFVELEAAIEEGSASEADLEKFMEVLIKCS